MGITAQATFKCVLHRNEYKHTLQFGIRDSSHVLCHILFFSRLTLQCCQWLHCVGSNVRSMINWKGCGKKLSWNNRGNTSESARRDWEKPTRNLNRRCPHRDSKQELPERVSTVLLLHQLVRSIICYIKTYEPDFITLTWCIYVTLELTALGVIKTNRLL
jgi:hypothetical protein